MKKAVLLGLIAVTTSPLSHSFAMACLPEKFTFKRGAYTQNEICELESSFSQYSQCEKFSFIYTQGNRSGYKIDVTKLWGSESSFPMEYVLSGQNITTYTFNSKISIDYSPQTDMLQFDRDNLSFSWYTSNIRDDIRSEFSTKGSCVILERAAPKI